MSYCLSCGSMVDEWDSAYYARNMLCIPCYTRKSYEVAMVSCSRCGTRVRQEEVRRKGGSQYCNYCASEIERVDRLPVCPLCNRRINEWDKKIRLANGQIAHPKCAAAPSERRIEVFCSICGQKTIRFAMLPSGKAICSKCERRPAASQHDHPLIASLMDRIGGMIG